MSEKVHPYKLPPGPQQTRKVKDIFFLILFIAFWIGMIVIAVFSLKYGDINRLLYGTDSSGNLCSRSNSNGVDASSLPSLYYFKPVQTGGYSRCILDCPTVNFQQSNAYICKYNVTAATDSRLKRSK